MKFSGLKFESVGVDFYGVFKVDHRPHQYALRGSLRCADHNSVRAGRVTPKQVACTIDSFWRKAAVP